MAVITPPFDSRRIQQYVVDGDGPTFGVPIDAARDGDRLSSVLAFDAGVFTNVTDNFLVSDGEITNVGEDDYSGQQLIVLIVHRGRPALIPPSAADGLQIFVATGTTFPDPVYVDGIRSGDVIHMVLAFPAVDTRQVFDVTQKFAANLDSMTMVDNEFDLVDNRLLVVWVPDEEVDGSLLFNFEVTAGTATDVDVAVTGVETSPPSNQWGVVAFPDGAEPGDRMTFFAPGTAEFEKTGGPNDTGNPVVFMWSDGDDTTPIIKWRAVTAGDVDGNVAVSGVEPGDNVIAVIRLSPDSSSPEDVRAEGTYIAGTDEIVRSGGELDQSMYAFMVWYEDLTP